jgi:hypothetical protein
MALKAKIFGCKLPDYVIEQYYPADPSHPDSILFDKILFEPTVTGAMGQDTKVELVVYAYDSSGNKLNGGSPVQVIHKHGTHFRPQSDLHLGDNKVEITKKQLDKVAAGNAVTYLQLFPEEYIKPQKPRDFTKFKVLIDIDARITSKMLLDAGVNRLRKVETRLINPSPPADAAENDW